MKRIQRWWTGLSLMLFSAVAAATDLGAINAAAARAGDKSREALVTVFGNVVNNPLATGGAGGGDTVLASIFQVSNGVIMVIAGLFVGYQLFRKTAQTAHDGSVFDKAQHTFWQPVRIVFGMSSLFPTANGWCVAQLMMLWAAASVGVGSANLATDGAIAAFQDGKSMVMQAVMPSTTQVARSVFEADLCMHAVNASLAAAQQSGALLPEDGFVQQSATNSGFVLKNASFVCGGADLNSDFQPQAQSTNWFSPTIDTSQIRQAHLTALQQMQSTLSGAAQQFVNAVVQRQSGGGAVPDAEMAIQSAAQQYENTVNAAVGTKQGDIASLAGQLSSSIKEGGWITLGAWYQTFAQANTKLNDAAAGKAHTYGPAANGDPGMATLYPAVLDAYHAQQASNPSTGPLAGSGSEQNKAFTATDPAQVIGSVFKAPGQRLVNALVTSNFAGGNASGQVNPLIKMKNIGDYTLGLAETGIGLYFGAKVISAVGDGWSVPGLFAKAANLATGVKDALKGAVDGLSPFIVPLILLLLLIGGMLSTYIPMVPFVIWFGAGINFLAVVGEGVMATPLWAFTHLGAQGEGMGDKSAHGYIFLLNAMLRPLLMVIGFFLGGSIVIAGGTLLNSLYGIAMANAQFDSITGLVSIVFFLFIYLSMCLNLIHTGFNLIYLVPDQVINWVGGHIQGALGRDDNDKLKHAIGGLIQEVKHLSPRSPHAGPDAGGTGGSGNPNGIRS